MSLTKKNGYVLILVVGVIAAILATMGAILTLVAHENTDERVRQAINVGAERTLAHIKRRFSEGALPQTIKNEALEEFEQTFLESMGVSSGIVQSGVPQITVMFSDQLAAGPNPTTLTVGAYSFASSTFVPLPFDEVSSTQMGALRVQFDGTTPTKTFFGLPQALKVGDVEVTIAQQPVVVSIYTNTFNGGHQATSAPVKGYININLCPLAAGSGPGAFPNPGSYQGFASLPGAYNQTAGCTCHLSSGFLYTNCYMVTVNGQGMTMLVNTVTPDEPFETVRRFISELLSAMEENQAPDNRIAMRVGIGERAVVAESTVNLSPTTTGDPGFDRLTTAFNGTMSNQMAFPIFPPDMVPDPNNPGMLMVSRDVDIESGIDDALTELQGYGNSAYRRVLLMVMFSEPTCDSALPNGTRCGQDQAHRLAAANKLQVKLTTAAHPFGIEAYVVDASPEAHLLARKGGTNCISRQEIASAGLAMTDGTDISGKFLFSALANIRPPKVHYLPVRGFLTNLSATTYTSAASWDGECLAAAGGWGDLLTNAQLPNVAQVDNLGRVTGDVLGQGRINEAFEVLRSSYVVVEAS